MSFSSFIYRAKNKALLKRLFIEGKGRYIGRPMYQLAIGLELGMRRLSDVIPTEPQGDQSFLNENLTAVIKTFERPGLLRRLVNSIRRLYPQLHIIVVDDSQQPTDLPGVETVVLPFDSGVSAGRNAGLARVQTPFTLMLDDDYVLFSKTRLVSALDIMRRESRIDLMGGARIDLPFYRVVDHSHSTLFPTHREPILPIGSEVSGLNVFDKVAQFHLSRTDRLRQIGWDERLKRIDHADFFTRARGKLLTVYNPEMRCLHAQDLFNRGYMDIREDGSDSAYLRFKYYPDSISAPSSD